MQRTFAQSELGVGPLRGRHDRECRILVESDEHVVVEDDCGTRQCSCQDPVARTESMRRRSWNPEIGIGAPHFHLPLHGNDLPDRQFAGRKGS